MNANRDPFSHQTSGFDGHPASPWPSEPVWAPPSTQLPPLGGPTTRPLDGRSGAVDATAPAPPPARRRRSTVVLATVAVAAVVGGGAGFAGASLADRTSNESVASSAEQLAYTTGTASGTELSDLVRAVEPSVVTIRTHIQVAQGPFGRTVSGEAAGTGVVLTSDGEILTNAHVVADATSITVTLDGESTAHTATLVGKDTDHDIALLKIDGVSGLTPAKLADSTAVTVGDDAIAIGNALNLDGGVTVTKGIISALDRSIDVENGHLDGLIQTDAAISSGNSGGPLLNAEGQVVGINTAGAASSDNVTAENIGFAIPIDAAMQIVTRLRSDA